MVNSKKGKVKQKKGQRNLRAYYLVLSLIAVLLILITAFLQLGRPDEESPASGGGISYPEIAVEELPDGEKDDAPPPVQAVPEKPEPIGKGTLIFVIDDVGNNLEQLDEFLKIPAPLVFAVMPQRPYTKESIRRIRDAGKMVIIHQPMESVGGWDPGKGALYVKMSEPEIVRILDENMDSTGNLSGLNNHMGSSFTTDPEVMRVVLKYLKDHNMFFLDSVTNTNLVGEEIAKELGTPYLKRNSMFLDNESDRESVLSAIMEGQRVAEKNGHAVMIGHVMTESLAELLLELYPTFMEDGFSVKDLSELLHGEYDVSTWN